MKKNILVLFLITMSIFAFGKKTQQTKITYIKMERTACYGKCPQYMVEFFKNGEVKYTGKNNVEMLGIYKATMSKKDIQQFFKQYEKTNITKLANEYPIMSTDLPGMNLDFIVFNKKKHIKHAEKGPRFLVQVAADIDEKVQQLKWTLIEAKQDNEVHTLASDDVMEYAEHMPDFPGGEVAMKAFFEENLKFPTSANGKKIEGKVVCNFVVDKEGNIRDSRIVRGFNKECDAEALRVINLMPKWTPGTQNGKLVNVSYSIPIFFKNK